MTSTETKTRLLVILGPTAVGKSGVAVELARQLDGEVISADSRQVYRGLDLGTGKITRAEMQGVPHHLIDIADPSETITVKKWKELAEKAISDISSRGKLPIICGGTGFYISSLVDNIKFPEISTDLQAQKDLEKKTEEELLAELKTLDPDRAETVDRHNKRRLARAIIIARELGSVPPLKRAEPRYEAIQIGIILPDEEMKTRIRERLIARIDAGMIDEARRLHENGLSYERMDDLGLEYRYLAQFLQNELTRDGLIEMLSMRIWQYARRQKTWFKKIPGIIWTAPAEAVTVALKASLR